MWLILALSLVRLSSLQTFLDLWPPWPSWWEGCVKLASLDPLIAHQGFPAVMMSLHRGLALNCEPTQQRAVVKTQWYMRLKSIFLTFGSINVWKKIKHSVWIHREGTPSESTFHTFYTYMYSDKASVARLQSTTSGLMPPWYCLPPPPPPPQDTPIYYHHHVCTPYRVYLCLMVSVSPLSAQSLLLRRMYICSRDKCSSDKR